MSYLIGYLNSLIIMFIVFAFVSERDSFYNCLNVSPISLVNKDSKTECEEEGAYKGLFTLKMLIELGTPLIIMQHNQWLLNILLRRECFNAWFA